MMTKHIILTEHDLRKIVIETINELYKGEGTIVKGSEIISRWNVANEMIKRLGNKIGEIGDYLRQHGYLCNYNGFNFCSFSCDDLDITFEAFFRDTKNPWHLTKRIYIITNGKTKELNVDRINSNEEFKIDANVAMADMIDSEKDNNRKFVVYTKSPSKITKIGVRNTSDDAEALAKKTFEDIVSNPWNGYFVTNMNNNKQRAKERREYRHYTYYNYPGHEHWISIDVEQ